MSASGKRCPLHIRGNGIAAADDIIVATFLRSILDEKLVPRPCASVVAAFALVLFACLASVRPALAQSPEQPLLLRQPTLSATDIVFAYGNDLWRVSRDGGEAMRLTAGPGTKSGPHFLRTANGSPSRASTTASATSTSSR